MVSPKELSKWAFQTNSPNMISKWGIQITTRLSVLGAYLDFDGCLLGVLFPPRNTITFQSSSLNGFSKWALKMGSPKEFPWSSMGVHCTGSLSSAYSSNFYGDFFAILCVSKRISSLNGLSKRALQMSSPSKISKWGLQITTCWVYWEPIRSLLGVCWESDFPIEYYQLPKQLSRRALQKSSPNELSKLRPVWSPLCWEFVGSPVGVWW